MYIFFGAGIISFANSLGNTVSGVTSVKSPSIASNFSS